jgi:hypothetical protein
LPAEKTKTKHRFETFRDKFLQLISSPHFGDPPHHQQRKTNLKESVAYRELRKTDLSLQLCSATFLHAFHQLIREHARLETEKQKVRDAASTARAIMGRYRYAQKRLKRIKRELEEFAAKYGDLMEPQIKQPVYSVLQQIETVGATLREREKVRVSWIYPKLRSKKDETSKRDALIILKDYDYDLESLNSRAADQWLWQAVYHQLGLLKGNPRRSLSDMTKFKLISAVCEAAGIYPFQPTAIKEYLRSKHQ